MAYPELAFEDKNNLPIAFSLPLRPESFTSEEGLHPFFDNLIAEGWLKDVQAKTLGVSKDNRFALLLGFGLDLAGAVSIVDPHPQKHKELNNSNLIQQTISRNKTSIGGVQKKILAVKEGKSYRLAKSNQASTYIAKLSSDHLEHIIGLEFLTNLAVKKLLPNDDIVGMEIEKIDEINEKALIIRRFDRIGKDQIRRLHFEEFNQLFGKKSSDENDKYSGAYEDLGKFILRTSNCIKAEAEKLFCRIIVCFLVGNTDAHLKNFAMFHSKEGLRLTPLYDVVPSIIYGDKTIALDICGSKELALKSLKPKHIIKLAESFEINKNLLEKIIDEIGGRLEAAKIAVKNSKVGNKNLRDQLITIIDKQWKISFASIGQLLLARQSSGAKKSK